MDGDTGITSPVTPSPKAATREDPDFPLRRRRTSQALMAAAAAEREGGMRQTSPTGLSSPSLSYHDSDFSISSRTPRHPGRGALSQRREFLEQNYHLPRIPSGVVGKGMREFDGEEEKEKKKKRLSHVSLSSMPHQRKISQKSINSMMASTPLCDVVIDDGREYYGNTNRGRNELERTTSKNNNNNNNNRSSSGTNGGSTTYHHDNNTSNKENIKVWENSPPPPQWENDDHHHTGRRLHDGDDGGLHDDKNSYDGMVDGVKRISAANNASNMYYNSGRQREEEGMIETSSHLSHDSGFRF